MEFTEAGEPTGVPVLTVTRLLSAMAAWDVQGAAELCSADLEYEVKALDVYCGHDGLRDFVADQRSMCDGLSTAVVRVVSQGPTVVVERVDSFFLRGGVLDVPTASFFDLDGGLVRHWRDYQDLRDLTRMLDY